MAGNSNGVARRLCANLVGAGEDFPIKSMSAAFAGRSQSGFVPDESRGRNDDEPHARWYSPCDITVF